MLGNQLLKKSNKIGGNTMEQTLLTRKDVESGGGLYDSIAWVFEAHVKWPDTGAYNSAILYGNEDAPERIDFYESASPAINSIPSCTWFPSVSDEQREYMERRSRIAVGVAGKESYGLFHDRMASYRSGHTPEQLETWKREVLDRLAAAISPADLMMIINSVENIFG